MQLNRPERIRTAVTACTAALLGTSANASAQAGKVDSSLLIYSEVNRVQAAEGVVDFKKTVNERRSYGLRLVLDALTGASPNGATPSTHVQTFTGASGSTGYTAPANEIPLDDTFTDKRLALDGTLVESLDRVTVVNAGGHFSIEHDYSSVGLSGGVSRDFNRRNTTLSLRGSYNHDTVSPIGGAPAPFGTMPPPTNNGGEGDGEGEGEGGGSGPGEGKNVGDVAVGLSQVIDRETIFQFDYSYGRSSGYLNDPYKLLSLVQNESDAEPGEPLAYLYESRPDARSRQSLFSEVRRYIAGGTVDVSYRYYWDDWGIRSNTVDFLSHLPIRGGRALEPHVRWYRQSAADFYTRYLVDGASIPSYASADARLAGFDAWTAGLKLSFTMNEFDVLSVGAEYYTQLGERGPPAIGILQNYDLFPKLDVFMLRVGFTHGF